MNYSELPVDPEKLRDWEFARYLVAELHAGLIAAQSRESLLRAENERLRGLVKKMSTVLLKLLRPESLDIGEDPGAQAETLLSAIARVLEGK